MSDGRGALLPRRRDPVETLRYSLEAFDGRDNLVEVLGRLADLSVAQVAYDAASRSIPDKRICPARRAA